MYATAEKATLNWTLGITEHHNGADGVFALIGLGAPDRATSASTVAA